jgi:hypothetical protein
VGASVASLAQPADRDRDGDRARVENQVRRDNDNRVNRDRDEHRDNDAARRDRDDRWRNHSTWNNGAVYRRGDGDRDDAYRGYPAGTYGSPTYRSGPYYGNSGYGAYGNSGYGAYGNGGYGAYGNGMGVAQQYGYKDGMLEGSNDRATGHSFRPTHDRGYQLATNGYQPQFGDRAQYQSAYRQAYEQGYQQGYNNSFGRVW